MKINYIVGDYEPSCDTRLGCSAEYEIKKQRALGHKRWKMKYDTKYTHCYIPRIMEDLIRDGRNEQWMESLGYD